MSETLILGGILLALWFLLLFLRVPSSIAFLSLLIGQLLSNEATSDVYGYIGQITHITNYQYIEMTLLLLPLFLTILFLHGRVQKTKLAIEALPTFLLAALTIVLVAPLSDVLNNLLVTATDDQADAYRGIIVVASSISGLLSAWLSYPKQSSEKKGKKKH